ncbi:hypothetical protein FACS189454_05410 [Planctomycetales bacterium]|nr:hypothetical protein FACS189454_05410 [Planctomycetales bacterium]
MLTKYKIKVIDIHELYSTADKVLVDFFQHGFFLKTAFRVPLHLAFEKFDEANKLIADGK